MGHHAKTAYLMNRILNVTAPRQPISVRGIAYQLFVQGLLPVWIRIRAQQVSRLTTLMREEGLMSWDWIVDEGRQTGTLQLKDPAEYIDTVHGSPTARTTGHYNP